MAVTGISSPWIPRWPDEDNHFNFVQDQNEWKDTEVVFDIRETDGGSEVQFTHVGLVPQHECYDVCANAWSGYITGSLRDLINIDAGQPNPKEDGAPPATPAHQDAANVHRASQPTDGSAA